MSMEYRIYQTKDRRWSFEGLDWARKHGFSKDAYRETYAGEIGADSAEAALEPIFSRHNSDNRPDAQTARSLSVSDVVEIGGCAYYCDCFGWKELGEGEWAVE